MMFGRKQTVPTTPMFDIERNSKACDMLGDLLAELGINGYGRVDDGLDLPANSGRTLTRTQRGVDIHNPTTGELLLRVREFWWDPVNDRLSEFEANLPNFDVPLEDFQVRWYKSAFRDAYANKPLTIEIAERIRTILHPALEATEPYTPHPVNIPVNWVETTDANNNPMLHGQARSANGIGNCDHATITIKNNRIKAVASTPDELCSCITYFDATPDNPDRTIEDAKAWCERRLRTWPPPRQ